MWKFPGSKLDSSAKKSCIASVSSLPLWFTAIGGMDDDAEFYIPPEKDLTGTVFSDPNFFRFFPVLNHATVMRYFEASPFYEQSYNLNSRTFSDSYLQRSLTHARKASSNSEFDSF